MGIEAERQLQLHHPLGEADDLLIRQIHGAEQLGACYEYVLSLYSEKQDVDETKLLGEHVSVLMRCGGQPERYIDGIVCEFGHTGVQGSFANYRMVLRPWLWLLSTRTDCRIFKNRSSVEIVRDVVAAWEDSSFALEVRVNDKPPPREFCVQYAESDLNFIMRLLEDDGIYFFFEHQLKQHKLIIADYKGAHKPAPGFTTIGLRYWDDKETSAASMLSWNENSCVKPGGVAMRDYDFEKPRADIDSDHKQPKTKQPREQKAILYEYPGQYLTTDKGDKRAKIRLEEAQVDFAIAEAESDASGLIAGSLFTLKGHKRKKLDKEYLVTGIAFEADSGVFESGGGASSSYRAKLHCIPSAIRFRPRRKTPWPVVPGAQTATVVGQKEGEIATDKQGRVQVHFPWNRARRPDKSADPPDDHCSCSVRLAQQWTGNGWGSLFIPRVGQEVLVEFLEGNPDRPLVTGSVYNNRNKAACDLPGKASQSGWRTRSVPEGGEDEYNELRFDDDKGHEEIHVQAQRDMNTTIKNDLTTSVGNDETHDVTGKLAVTVAEGDYTIDVKQGFMNVYIHQDNHTTQAKSIYATADREIVLTVMQSSISLTPDGIEIKFGANTIKLGPTGIQLVGLPQVTLNS